MKIVHICSQYFTSKLYLYLIDGLKKYGYKQLIYVPLNKSQKTSYPFSNFDDRRKSTENETYIFDRYLNKYFRYLLLTRTFIYSRRIAKFIDIKNSIIHAHTLFSSGGIAYWLNKRYHINYIVAVRNTDLELINRFKFYKIFAYNILKNSKSIIFISHSLKNKFLENFSNDQINTLNYKIKIIPNGIPEFWINEEKAIPATHFNFIYQGNFLKRKNVLYSISLIESLNDRGYKCNFNIFGEGEEKNDIINKINNSKFYNNFTINSWVKNMEDIKNNYVSNDIYIMPSSGETFGIAYLEALACGLPIVYKKDDGIDGFFNHENPVGVALNVNDFENDLDKLQNLLDNYSEYQKNTLFVAKKFLWSNILEMYKNVYDEI